MLHAVLCIQVYILRMVFDMGFVVMHADSDITWFKDPFPYFRPVRVRPAIPRPTIVGQGMGP